TPHPTYSQMHPLPIQPHRAHRALHPFPTRRSSDLGIPTINESREKTMLAIAACPETNIWCPQTRNPIKDIAKEEIAIAQYPKMCFRLKVVITSETIPKPGMIIM